MEVYIADIPPEGCRLKGEEPDDILDLHEDVLGQACPVTYDLSVQLAGNELIARGSLTAQVEFKCCRCAEMFAVTVTERRFFAVVEIPNKVESVDLTPDIREAMILAFPSYPVCDSGCKGLCAQCGVNLNRETCSCTEAGDKRWNILDGLEGI